MIYGNPKSEIMIFQLNNYENLYFTIHFYVKTGNADFIFHNTLYTKKCNSEGARGIILNLVSFNALGSKYMETKVRSVANSFQELFHSRHFVTGQKGATWFCEVCSCQERISQNLTSILASHCKIRYHANHANLIHNFFQLLF